MTKTVSSPHRSGTDEGSALPILVVALAVLCSLVLGVARLGVRSVDRARAETAADAAALAGAHHGWPGAERLATLNDGELVTFVDTGGTVTVQVKVGSVVAAASARLDA
jgi:Putative Flp pilus-assembly TadE/G-like